VGTALALAVVLAAPVFQPESERPRSLSAATAAPLINQFTLTDLGALGAESALGLNDAGDVVGYQSGGNGFHYQQGAGDLSDLGPGAATAVSDTGLVVGFGRGTGAGGKSWGISSNGLRVSGAAPQPGIIPQAYGNNTSWPAIWSKQDGWRSLYDAGCRLPGLIAGLAYSINDSGTLVGQAVWDADGVPSDGGVAGVAFECTPSPTDPGVYSAINLAPYGGAHAGAFAINNRGQIAGKADSAGNVIQAYRWDATNPVPLGTTADGHQAPAGSFYQSAGFGINESGDVVGSYGPVASSPLITLGARQNRAFVWYSDDHVMRDINDLMPVASQWKLNVATDINNRGQIVGQGTLNGQLRGFLFSPTGDVNITADHIMVTQVVQNEENFNLLVEHKQTFAIVRVHSDTRSVHGVTAVLRGYRAGNQLGEIKPVSPPLSVLQNPKRADVHGSFVFALPRAWTRIGDLTLEAEVNDDFEVTETSYRDNQTPKVTVAFQESPALNIEVVNLFYQGQPPPLLVDMEVPYDLLRNLVGRLFPVAGLSIKHHTTAAPIAEPSPEGVGTKCGKVVAELTKIRAAMNVSAKTLVYGQLPIESDGSFPYGGTVLGCSYVPDLVATGWTGSNSDFVAAHELSHAIGRNHVPQCGAVGADTPGYPTSADAGISAGSIHQDAFRMPDDMDLGFDGSSFLAPNSPKDLMTYCDVQWISDYTYENLYQAIPRIGTRERASLQPGTMAVQVVGTIDLLNESTSLSLTYAPLEARPAAPIPGPYHLEFYNGATKLSDVSFTPVELGPHETAGAESPQGLINETVALPVGADRMAVYSDQSRTEISSTIVAGVPPTVSLVSPQSGQQLPASGSVTFEWSATDADSSHLSYTLLYRPIDSAPWEVLASGIRETTAVVDVSALPGALDGRVRVVAHDGFYTARDDATGIRMAQKPRKAIIESPSSGFTASTEQAVLLTGLSDGPDESDLPDASYVWASDRDGVLGTGRSVLANSMSVGEHRVVLTVSAPDGDVARAATTVVIGAAGQTTPTLAVSHDQLDFTFGATGVSEPQTLEISDLAGTSLDWTATADDPRLTLTSSSGTTPASIGVSIDTTGLRAGDRLDSNVRIRRADGQQDPLVVGVTAQSSEPVTSLSIYAIDFGRQTQGTASQPRTVELTYNGPDLLSLGESSLAGAGPGEFALSEDQCSNQTLASGESCTLHVSFAPTVPGRRTAYVTFQDADSAVGWYASVTGLAIRKIAAPDGTLVVWGDNHGGEAGVALNTPPCNRCVPVPSVVQGITDVTAVAAGHDHSVAATEDGRAWAWGMNCSGALGIGTEDCGLQRPTPQPVAGLADVIDVAAGLAYSLALHRNGTVSGWGSNTSAAVDVCAGFRLRVSPVLVRLSCGSPSPLAGVASIAAGTHPNGGGSSYALKADGTVWQWGHPSGMHQVLGPGGVGLANIVEIGHGIALREDGTVWAWGYGADGQLGNGQRPSSFSAAAVQVLDPTGAAPLTGVRGIASYQSERYALMSDGGVLAWGAGAAAFSGNPDAGIALGTGGTHPDGVALPTPVLAPAGAGPLSGVLDLAPGFAAHSDGTVSAWGRGTAGELGNGTYLLNPWTEQIPGPAAPVKVMGVDGQGLLVGVARLAGGQTRFGLSQGGQASTLTAGAPGLVSTSEGEGFDTVIAGFDDTASQSQAALFTADVDWGDGTASTSNTVTGPIGGPFEVRGTHVYSAPGSYGLTIDVVSRSGDSVTLHGSASVADAALTQITGPVVATTAGAPVAGALVSFRDSNTLTPETDFTATVSWGDGTANSEGTVLGPPGGPFVVSANHTYGRAESYPVMVTVSDTDGSEIVLRSTAEVEPAPLMAATTVASYTLPNDTFTGQLATFLDGNPLSTRGDFTAVIDWGDGSQTSGTVAGPDGGPYAVAGSHSFTSLQPATVSVTLEGPAGISATAHTTLLMRDQRISVTASSDRTRGDIPFSAVYTYVVSNDGKDPLTGVEVVGSVCGAAELVGGDDGNGVLDPDEQWSFSCSHVFLQPGTFTDVSHASASGLFDAFPIQSQQAPVEVVATIVAWPFDGFNQPVDNAPVVNSVKAGSTVPVKFGLGGDRGLDIFAAGFPASARTSCTSGPVDALESVAAPGAATLTYDVVTGRYQFNWKTNSSWAGTCRQLALRFVTGEERIALFRFK
jgi:alpha-tubulin suppressor-like RCC1 family protein